MRNKAHGRAACQELTKTILLEPAPIVPQVAAGTGDSESVQVIKLEEDDPLLQLHDCLGYSTLLDIVFSNFARWKEYWALACRSA